MTRKQFDDMMIFLDDPDMMSVGGSCDGDDSMDEFSMMQDDGVTYSPVEMPDVVPAYPSEIQESHYFSDDSTREAQARATSGGESVFQSQGHSPSQGQLCFSAISPAGAI